MSTYSVFKNHPMNSLNIYTVKFLGLVAVLVLIASSAEAQQNNSDKAALPALEEVKESVLSPSLLQFMPQPASPAVFRPFSDLSAPDQPVNLQSQPSNFESTVNKLPVAPLRVVGDLIQLRIVINTEVRPNRVANALEQLGMQSLQRRGNLITGRLPVSQIENLVSIRGISDVRPSFADVRSGSTVTQGDEAAYVDIARTVSALDGSGITIGILSDSYDCLNQASTDMTNGDLPSAINVLDDGFCGTDEGRAMMQIAHDMAPGADLAFHTAFLGELDFAIGIDELVQAGADIIVDDVFYFEEPFFQDGVIAQAARDASLAGVPYFASAGNAGRTSWEGSYSSSGLPSVISSGDPHEFSAGDVKQTITLSPFSNVTVVLQWDDPYSTLDPASPGPDTDLDIALLNSAGSVIAFSAETNIGSDPYEVITYANFSFNPIQVEVVIEKQSGPDPSLMKWVGFHGVSTIDEYDNASGTIVGHANADSIFSVGAVNYTDAPRFSNLPPVLASYSSGGPAPILFLADGTPTGPITRDNPDFTAPDAGNNTIIGPDSDNDGFPNFFGTSAAVVHAASVAALLLEHTPGMTPTEIETALETTAIDHGPTGYDPDTGHGFIDADETLSTVLIPPSIDSPIANATLDGSSITIDWNTNEFNIDSWQVLVGTTAPTAGGSSNDLFDSGPLGATDMSVLATGLPEDDSTVYLTLEWTYASTSGSTTIELVSNSATPPSLTSPVPSSSTPLPGSNVEFIWTAGTSTVSEWRLQVGTSGPLSSDLFDSGPIVGSATGTTATGLPLAGELLYATLNYTTSGTVQSLEYIFDANSSVDFVTVPPGEWHLLSIPATSTQTFGDFTAGHLDPADFNNLTSEKPWIAFRYDSELFDPATGLPGTYVSIDLTESLDSLIEGFWLIHLSASDVNLDLPSDAVHASGAATNECPPGYFCESVSMAYGLGSGGWIIGTVPSALEPQVDILRVDTTGTGTICDSGCNLTEADQQGIAASTVWTYDPAASGGSGDYVLLSGSSNIPKWSGFWIFNTAAGAQGLSEIEIPVR